MRQTAHRNELQVVVVASRYREFRWSAIAASASLVFLLSVEDAKTAFHWTMLPIWTLVLLTAVLRAWMDRSDRLIAERSKAYRSRLARVEEDRHGE